MPQFRGPGNRRQGPRGAALGRRFGRRCRPFHLASPPREAPGAPPPNASPLGASSPSASSENRPSRPAPTPRRLHPRRFSDSCTLTAWRVRRHPEGWGIGRAFQTLPGDAPIVPCFYLTPEQATEVGVKWGRSKSFLTRNRPMTENQYIEGRLSGSSVEIHETLASARPQGMDRPP